MKKLISSMMLLLLAFTLTAFSWESDYTAPAVTAVTAVEGTREITVAMEAVTGSEVLTNFLSSFSKMTASFRAKTSGKARKAAVRPPLFSPTAAPTP